MLEPSAGSGSFVSAFLSCPESGVDHILAVERDAVFCSIGSELWTAHGCDYVEDDFTRLSPLRLVDLVVANPPYVRHHALPRDEKLRLQAQVAHETGIAISGLAGLYCHFLMLSRKWMKPGAVGVWLVPIEWMSVNYGAAIRRFLTERVNLLRIHTFDSKDVLFSDALVSSCVIWFRNEAPSQEALFTRGRDLTVPVESARIPTERLAKSEKWPPLQMAETARDEAVPRLRDFFKVKRGLVTGDNGFFVLSEERMRLSNIPSSYLKPIVPSPRNLKADVVSADASGLPSNVDRLFLLDCTGREFETLPATVRDYLSSGLLTTARKKICAGRTRWYDQEQREPSPFLCSYMGRGKNGGTPVRFIYNQSHALAANSYLILYAIGPLRHWLNDHPEDCETVWRILGRIPPESFRRSGRCYGGGLCKMEPRELGDLPCEELGQWLKDLNPSALAADVDGQMRLAL